MSHPNIGLSMNNLLTLSVLGFALLASVGCASTPAESSSVNLSTVAPIIARPDGAVRVDTQSNEVARLWAAAETARSQNKLAISLELLYEALEIDPSNSLLWSRAAELQLDNVEPALAENYALRSNASAGEHQALLYRNWLIIEHARSMRGDLLGVRSAHKQVQLYRYQ